MSDRTEALSGRFWFFVLFRQVWQLVPLCGLDCETFILNLKYTLVAVYLPVKSISSFQAQFSFSSCWILCTEARRMGMG